jgi:outer membrane lipoprotein LolB
MPMAARRRAARGALLAMTLWLGACATVSPPILEADAQWARRQQQLATIERWVVQGRLGIETRSDGGTATLNWEQDGASYAMRIMAPLGQGTFELRGNEDGVSLRTPDNRQVTARDPESLMQQSLGWSLPVAGMRYWVRGLPVPGHPIEQIRVDDSGHLLDLQQDGWRISMQRYRTVGGHELPDKIFMESEPLKMRVLISEWQLP